MHGRCDKCNGSGYVVFDEDRAFRMHCACPLGLELKRVDEKFLRSRVITGAVSERVRKMLEPDYKRRASGDSD